MFVSPNEVCIPESPGNDRWNIFCTYHANIFMAVCGDSWEERPVRNQGSQCLFKFLVTDWKEGEKKSFWPPVICQTHKQVLIHTLTHTVCPAAPLDSFSARVTFDQLDIGRIKELIYSRVNHTHLNKRICMRTSTQVYRHIRLSNKEGPGVLLPKPWPKVAPSAGHE